MEAIDQYKLLFEDTFFNSLVFIFTKKYVYDVMGILGARTKIDSVIYIVASLLAFNANYIIGLLVAKYFKALQSYENYIKFTKVFNKYLFPISLFCFAGLWGGLFAFISGLTKFKYRYFFLLSAIGLVFALYFA